MPASAPRDRHQRRSIRRPDYDYSQAGAYFITMCTHEREALLGEIAGEAMRLNACGEIVSAVWHAVPQHDAHVALDEFVIMPNHVHGIIVIENNDEVGAIHESPVRESPLRDPRERRRMLLPKIIGYFKMNTAKRINELRQTPGVPVWQRNYYERVIHNERELNAVRDYVRHNPLNWALDHDNPQSRR